MIFTFCAIFGHHTSEIAHSRYHKMHILIRVFNAYAQILTLALAQIINFSVEWQGSDQTSRHFDDIIAGR